MAAHGVADDVEFADLQSIQQGQHALALAGDVVAEGGRLAAVTKTRQVEGDDPVLRRQRTGEAQPVVLVGAKAVDHHDGRRVLRAAVIVAVGQVANGLILQSQSGELALGKLYGGQQGGWRQGQYAASHGKQYHQSQ